MYSNPLKIALLAVSLVIAVVSDTESADSTKATLTPKTVVWDGNHMARVRAGDFADDLHIVAALQGLRESAEAALKRGPYSVVDHGELPPSGDQHDYVSYATYFWPNPDTDDGLPFIRRDGESNRAQLAEGDRQALDNLSDDVATLALAGYFFDDARFSDHAAKLLRAWFFDSATAMNPHLNYGQGILGKCEGRCFGIIDTQVLVFVVEAARVLKVSSAWTAKDEQALQGWMSRYLDWLLSSPFGLQEQATKNNHATYYDAQVAALALYTGKQELARKVLEEVKTRRIDTQIEADGKQPEEIARTCGLGYSFGNLSGMCLLARLAECVDVNLWVHQSPEGGSIRKALDFLMPFLLAEQPWPYEQIKEVGRPWTKKRVHGGALYLAAARFREPRYLLPALDEQGQIAKGDMTCLLFPAVNRPVIEVKTDQPQ